MDQWPWTLEGSRRNSDALNSVKFIINERQQARKLRVNKKKQEI